MKSFAQFLLLENPPAWHGTPHHFDAFSLENIGTGEGANDFGWGLYFTSSKAVADYYSGNQGIGGSPVPSFFEIKGVRTERGTSEQKAADLIHSMGLAKARTFAKGMLKDAQRGEEWTKDKDLEYYERIYEITLEVKKQSEVKKAKGNIYHVDIIPSENQMLDWDKQLSEQSKEVIKAIGMSDFNVSNKEKTGVDFYRELAQSKGSKKAASLYLLSIGIRGIKYLDALSRSAGKGSMNYVIFSDKDVVIKEKI